MMLTADESAVGVFNVLRRIFSHQSMNDGSQRNIELYESYDAIGIYSSANEERQKLGRLVNVL